MCRTTHPLTRALPFSSSFFGRRRPPRNTMYGGQFCALCTTHSQIPITMTSTGGADPEGMDRPDINTNAVKSEIRVALINRKANACPIAMRLAWHAAGTFDQKDQSGGSNGGRMRFSPEKDDDANAGLSIVRDLLQGVKEAHPEISHADLWALAGGAAIEFTDGPKIKFAFGRKDESSGVTSPANGRLPDAAQGAAHLRDVFGRMGFNDQEIVALSGAHTLGRCHAARSGFDGPWTHHPLRFDNKYFTNLLELEWKKREWDGPFQFTDTATGKLMMLPTDMALKTDPKFRVHAERYAKDEQVFFKEFAAAFEKLQALGCPAAVHAGMRGEDMKQSEKQLRSAEFRELAMHGSVQPAKKLFQGGNLDAHAAEATSGRTALHKAAFWGHNDMMAFLLDEVKMNVDAVDMEGDTALHDAARFGHEAIAKLLVAAKAKTSIRNKQNMTAAEVAVQHNYQAIAALLKGSSNL